MKNVSPSYLVALDPPMLLLVLDLGVAVVGGVVL